MTFLKMEHIITKMPNRVPCV